MTTTNKSPETTITIDTYGMGDVVLLDLLEIAESFAYNGPEARDSERTNAAAAETLKDNILWWGATLASDAEIDGNAEAAHRMWTTLARIEHERQGGHWTAEEIEGLDAAASLWATGEDEIMADGDLYETLLDHIAENARDWYHIAQDEGYTTIAIDLRQFAENIFGEDLDKDPDVHAAPWEEEPEDDKGAEDDSLAEAVANWRRDPANANKDFLAEAHAIAANDNDGDLYLAGKFDGIAMIIAIELASADGNRLPHDFNEAIYKAYNRPW